MGKIIISDNVSLDGVVQNPAGDEGFRPGGWAGRPAARATRDLIRRLLDAATFAEYKAGWRHASSGYRPDYHDIAVRLLGHAKLIVTAFRSRRGPAADGTGDPR